MNRNFSKETSYSKNRGSKCDENVGSGLEQTKICGRVKLVNGILSLSGLS